jgi:hypothetical protein
MQGSYVRSVGPAAGFAAVAANGSTGAIAIPVGQWETSVELSTGGTVTAGTVTIDVSYDPVSTTPGSVTNWHTFPTATGLTPTSAAGPLAGPAVILPPGANWLRHTLAAIAGGGTVTSNAYFRQRA